VIVVISDVHLGLEECNKKDFEKFIDKFLAKKKIESLVLLGDILDFWRRPSLNVMFENLDILYKLSRLNTKKYYIIGNHDYSLCDMGFNMHFEFTKDVTLKSGGENFRFVHGHQLEYPDWLYFYEKLSSELCSSGPEMTQIQADTWSVYQKLKSVTKQGIVRPLLQKGTIYTEKLRDLDSLNEEQLKKIASSLVTPLKTRKSMRTLTKRKDQKGGLHLDEQLKKIAGSLTALKDKAENSSKKNQKTTLNLDEQLKKIAGSLAVLKDKSTGKTGVTHQQSRRPDEYLGNIIKAIAASPRNRKQKSTELVGTERLLAQKSIGLTADEFLIYGHTHEPFVREDVANAGSWVADADNQNTYLLIKNGKVLLKSW
jgi:UDP-2,3-diacylglucosamine pyrophosphatase LpxH